VTLAELLALPKSLDYAYRTPDAAPVWMFSDGVEAILKGMLASTSGVRLFPEMDGGELLGYKFCVNVDMPQSLTATGKTIAFGSFKNGVTIRQSTPIVAVSKERYAEFFQTYFALVHRQDCVVSDANAIAVLQMHA
jgi:HK97 family phage major capsid protein